MGITVVGTVNAIEAELQNELNPIYLLLKGNPILWKKKCAQTKILMITVVTLWSVKSYVALNLKWRVMWLLIMLSNAWFIF